MMVIAQNKNLGLWMIGRDGVVILNSDGNMLATKKDLIILKMEIEKILMEMSHRNEDEFQRLWREHWETDRKINKIENIELGEVKQL